MKFETKLAEKLGGPPEPLFLCLYLYDLKAKQPVSEMFHLDFNTKSNYEQLGVKVSSSFISLFFLTQYSLKGVRNFRSNFFFKRSFIFM